MFTFLATFAAFGVAVFGLAVGVVVSGRRLRGSCGGEDACACADWKARTCPRRRAVAGSGGRPSDPE